jgi:hypothetical protein
MIGTKRITPEAGKLHRKQRQVPEFKTETALCLADGGLQIGGKWAIIYIGAAISDDA